MCNIKEKLKKIDPNGYSVWKASHNCQLNYRGSAPGMEVTGAQQRIFSRSMEKHKLRYTEWKYIMESQYEKMLVTCKR